MRSDLTDQYYEELEDKKTRHALELEQLRAKLSDRHLHGTSLHTHTHIIKYKYGVEKLLKLNNDSSNIFVAELTRVRLEAARQVEVRRDNRIIYPQKKIKNNTDFIGHIIKCCGDIN